MLSNFEYRGLWQWNPVSCVDSRSYDERYMMKHNDWFFNHSFMERYFEKMAEAGLNTWILANTHPFPFMADLSEFPEAKLLDECELKSYQNNYRHLFKTARQKGIKPFVLFHTCYVPNLLGEKYDIKPTHGYKPPQLAYDYTRYCVKQLCDAYPELEGINGDASENIAPAQRADFARDAIVAGIHDSRHRPTLFFRGWISDPEKMKKNILDNYEGKCFFTVKYTWEFLIHKRPDPEFMRWIEACSSSRVIPEFWISNFQPFGCHDLELAAGIRQELKNLGCPGFVSHPMDIYGAPFAQGTENKILQIERDHDWFATLSGRWRDGHSRRSVFFGVKQSDIDSATAASSKPFIDISYYITGEKQNFFQPQWLAYIGHAGKNGERLYEAGLQSFHQWERCFPNAVNAYGRWMKQIDNIDMRFPTETEGEFGLEELIKQLEAILSEWREPPLNPRRRKKLYRAYARELKAQYLIGKSWLERAKAIHAHFSGKSEKVPPALKRSLKLLEQVPQVLSFNGDYRLLAGRHTLALNWAGLIEAMKKEIADYQSGALEEFYPFGQVQFHD